nr:retrovirus-related Pol polyprotein from transposon TNT 1-94 [Tanacetum cinerariifolium]
MSYITNYKEINRGYVAFEGNPKGRKITGREAFNTACYVQNRVLVVKPYNKTPYELFHGRTPALSFMRPFGCPVTILNTKDHIDKFDGKADEGFFIGYSLNSKAFRVFNNRTRIVEENLHIRFNENTPNIAGSGPNWLFYIDALTKSMIYKQVVVGNQSNGNASTKACDDADPRQESECKVQEKEDNMPALEDIRTFNFSSDHEDDDEEADMNNLDTSIQVSPNPTTRIHTDHLIEQVTRDLHLTTHIRNMSKNLKEHRAIGTKWVFRNKKDERGIMIRNKARLITQGQTQEEGIDYDEVFAPVSIIEAIRLFLAYASFKGFVVYQMDVKIAFLYGKIEEEVYVCQPSGFEDPDFLDKVYKVEKSLYGLHQAPRAWYETLSTYLLDNGFHRGNIDKTLFIRRHKDDILLVQVYVDDIIFGLTKKKLCNAFEKMMHEKFQMSSMGELTFFLGLQAKTVNGDGQLQALVDGKKVIRTESTIRRDLQLEDAEGVDCLPNAFIFKHLTLIGIYVIPSHTKKIFRNIKRVEKGFSGRDVPLSPTMMVQEDMGKDEVMDDSLEMATTTATRLDAKQDRCNISKTQSKATPNELGSQGTSSGGVPKCQEAIRDTVDQTRSRTHKLKRLCKVGVSARMESSENEGSGEEDASKQWRIADIDAKAKGIVFHDPEDSITTTTAAIPKPRSQDRCKGKMIKEPMKEQRLAVERAQQEVEANIALIKSWDDVQAKIDADYQLAKRLEADEQYELNDEEKAKLFMQLLEKRIKFSAIKRAKEKRSKPPTQAQQRKIMCTYLKNMEGKKLIDLNNKSLDSIKKMFNKAFKRVNTFVDYRTKLVKESSMKAKEEVIEGCSKRARTKLEQECVKK